MLPWLSKYIKNLATYRYIVSKKVEHIKSFSDSCRYSSLIVLKSSSVLGTTQASYHGSPASCLPCQQSSSPPQHHILGSCPGAFSNPTSRVRCPSRASVSHCTLPGTAPGRLHPKDVFPGRTLTAGDSRAGTTHLVFADPASQALGTCKYLRNTR